MAEELIFETYKFRCSSLGHIMTNLPEKFSDEDEAKLAALLYEKETGILPTGNKNRGWTESKEDALLAMQRNKDGKDVLPTGVITHLENVFRAVFWGRKRFMHNKYVEKGLITEEDGLDLISKLDGVSYWKNEEHFENDYIQGTPDSITEKVRDIKANYDLQTFDDAELSKLYDWQLKGYDWLLGLKEGELCYCLLNTPYHRLEAERKTLFFNMGQPLEDEPRWIEAVCQLEKNMIFDMALFKKEYPYADLMHGRSFEFPDGSVRTIEWKYDIPPHLRVKRFDVTLEEGDIEHIIRRVKMCRKWLVEKEKQTLKLIDNEKVTD